MTHDLLNVLVLVVSLGVAARWIAWRMRLPAIVLFLLAGVAGVPYTHLSWPIIYLALVSVGVG